MSQKSDIATGRIASRAPGASRRRVLQGGLAAALAAPVLNSGPFRAFADAPHT